MLEYSRRPLHCKTLSLIADKVQKYSSDLVDHSFTTRGIHPQQPNI